jgi:hypothetical protein
MRNIPSPIDTIGALFKGHLPRVFQGRGWVLAGLVMLPFIFVWLVAVLDSSPSPATTHIELYHYGYGAIALPIMALVAASFSTREDLEQRVLPLMLVRPAPAWALPFGKGLLWFSWCAVWLMIAVSLMPLVGLDVSAAPRKMLALLLVFWAQLGFASLFIWFFKRGTLWAALFFFIWDRMIEVLPPALQKLTFTHYLWSIAGSSHDTIGGAYIVSQIQTVTPFWLSAVILLAFGLLAWGIIGFSLMHRPIGLAGSEAEG